MNSICQPVPTRSLAQGHHYTNFFHFLLHHHFPLSTEGFLSTEKYAISFPILKTFLSWSQFFLYHCPISLLPFIEKILRTVVCICSFEFSSFSIQVSTSIPLPNLLLSSMHHPAMASRLLLSQRREGNPALSLNSRAALRSQLLCEPNVLFQFLSPRAQYLSALQPISSC